MQKLERDPAVQKKIDELVREFEWDKKWKAEGIEEGIKEGESKAKLEIALNLLSKRMPLEEISEVTGLPLDKLKQLKS